MKEGDDSRQQHNNWNGTSEKKQEGTKLWGILLFGAIGATFTTFAVGQLRQTVNWIYGQLSRSQYSWKNGRGSSHASTFKEEAWRRYDQRLREEFEEEKERVERIRRMQSVFNRESNKYKRKYESWRENDAGSYHHNFQRDDWYWKTDSSYRSGKTDSRDAPREAASYPLSHHYTVLGLDRSRAKPYAEAEIKGAFRAKALEFHPDHNQNNREAAETKFKELLTSYEAIKLERRNANM